MPEVVDSILDRMVDGREYQSVVDLVPSAPETATADLRRALTDLETIRGRPCLCYIANLVHPNRGATGIASEDDLPFSEMVGCVSPEKRDVDLFVVTPGGSAQQVNQFVDRVRARFDHAAFILPWQAMSAGTLWALSGDEIWMDDRSYIGPIDPQVPTKNGGLLPVQSLLLLVRDVQQATQEMMKKGQQPPWTLIRMIDNIDPKEYGSALISTQYVKTLAQSYLAQFKFKHWTVRATSGQPVTDDYRRQRAEEIADQLSQHGIWQSHSHGISRQVAEDVLRLKIEHLESNPDLHRAVRRLWAMFYYVFEKGPTRKVFLSQDYMLAMNAANIIVGGHLAKP